ncbi:MAG: FadR family transcriptional regulator [Spirochaetes bacterium]|nr:FadR family transcriptional regulator [Spirochaetota bacterium]
MFDPVNNKRSFEDVAEQIKEKILSGSLKPFKRLQSERELASQFNTSRITIRSAIQILEGLGFLEVKTGVKGGAFVRQLDSMLVTQSIFYLIKAGQVSFTDFIQARILIEEDALKLAIARINNNKIKELREIIKLSEYLLFQKDDHSYRKFRESMGRFHICLANASGNRLYEYLISSMLKLSLQFVEDVIPDPNYDKSHLSQHLKLLDAIYNKNFNNAKSLLRKNILELNALYKKV